MRNRVAVIGGGAAGMVAAISAAESGAETFILEKNERIGKKLLATGNGRCNFTNIHMAGKYYHSSHSGIVEKILLKYTSADIIGFFETLGLMHRVEGEGRVYPRSGQASAVLDCLRNQLQFLGVDIKGEHNIVDIRREGQRFIIKDLKGEKFYCDKVIVATGGKAFQSSGSDGYGIKLLKGLGHESAAFFPALVQLRAKENFVKGLQGIRAACKATAMAEGKILRSEQGEVQFTAYGLSGIPIMQLSGLFHNAMDFMIELDFFPEYTVEALAEVLKKRLELFCGRGCTVEDFLTGVVHKKLGQCIMKLSGISKLSLKAAEIQENQMDCLAKLLKSLVFHIEKTNGFENAQVTGGGILLREFDENTLESKIVPGLYGAGEVFDIYGDCGGYNLHWAWLSGIIAGESAAV